MPVRTAACPRRLLWPALAVLLAALALLTPASPASAESQNPLAELDRDQQRIFKAYTRLFMRQFFRYGENRYVLLPNHMRNRENSSGMSMDQAQEVMTEVIKVRQGFSTIEKKIPPPYGEVVARAKLLPEMEVGHYGFVSSFTIKKVLGPEEMLVSNVRLIPADALGSEKNTFRKRAYDKQDEFQYKTYRVLGFKTDSLSEGQTWSGSDGKGIHIAVISTDPTPAASFVLVNFNKLERIRTSEFPDALSYVHLEPLVFIEMVRSNKEQHGAKGNTASLISIYRRFYNRYQPSRVTVKPPTRPTPERDDRTTATPSEEEEDDGPKWTLDPPKPGNDDKPETPASDEGSEEEDKPAPRDEADEPAEEEEDDWEYDEDNDTSPEDPTFFGIPLDG